DREVGDAVAVDVARETPPASERGATDEAARSRRLGEGVRGSGRIAEEDLREPIVRGLAGTDVPLHGDEVEASVHVEVGDRDRVEERVEGAGHGEGGRAGREERLLRSVPAAGEAAAERDAAVRREVVRNPVAREVGDVDD